MKVSIIIPAHNVEKYIERCIQSVMHQTYNNIECIIVDDCSTDDTANICKRLINNYQGTVSFTLIEHKNSKGPSGARNSGTDAATGEYIFYLDSDDEITYKCISLLCNIAKKHPHAEIIQGCTIAEKNREYYSLNRYNTINNIDDNEWIRKEYFRTDKCFPADVWNKLIQKKFLVENNIRFKEGIIHEDQLWSYNVITKLQHIYFLHENTYIHYSVPQSIMTSLSTENSYRCWGKILEEIVPVIAAPQAKLQIQKYLLEYIEKHEYFQKTKTYTRLLNNFIEKAYKNKEIKLAIALYAFELLGKYGCNSSIKQWILTYCRYNTNTHLHKEIFADTISLISKKIKQ